MWIQNYVIQEISDDKEYINSLGVPEVELKKQSARRDKEEQMSMSRIKEIEQSKESRVKQLQSQVQIAEADTKLKLTQAKNRKGVNVKKAIADLSQTMTETRIKQQLVSVEQGKKMVRTTVQYPVGCGRVGVGLALQGCTT